MPCISDYEESSAWDYEVIRAAKLAVFVCSRTGAKCPPQIISAAEAKYAVSDEPVAFLCGMLQAMDDKLRDDIIYDARNPSSRALADWWERHQAMDRAREEREAAEERRAWLRQQAIAKLTPEEIEALGL